MKRKLRGSGFKHTLPAVFSFSALWVLLLVLTPPVLIISMILSDIVPPALHGQVWFFLFTRMPIIALAAVGLGIFTTTRVAGPMVYLTRAFMDVERGNMDCRVRFRDCDTHLRGVETAFNAMMVALNERAESRRSPEAEDQGASRPPQPSLVDPSA